MILNPLSNQTHPGDSVSLPLQQWQQSENILQVILIYCPRSRFPAGTLFYTTIDFSEVLQVARPATLCTRNLEPIDLKVI